MNQPRQMLKQAWQSINRAMLTTSVGPEAGVRYWRERIFLTLYFFGMLAGLLLFIPSVIALAIKGFVWVSVVDTIVYLVAVWVFLTRSLSFENKCRFSATFLYAIGSAIYLSMGPTSAGPVWMFGFPIITALFLGIRPTIIALLLNTLTLIAISLAIHWRIVDWVQPVHDYFWSWLLIAVNFLFVNTLVAIAVMMLVRSIELAEQSKTEAESALLVSEEKFAKAFQESPVWVVLSELDTGAYIEVNESFLRSTGFTRDEISGQSSLTMGTWADPNDRRKIKAMLDADGHFRNFEVTRINKAGQRMEMIMSGEVIELKGVKYLLSVSTNMTEIKKAQEALKHSEERFRLTFETSPDSISIHRVSDGLYVDANQGFTKMIGYSREEIEGKSSLDLNIWHDPQDRSRMVELLRADGKVENLETTLRRKDGSLLTGLMSVVQIDLEGEPHLISITRDITSLKKAEQERAELQTQLQHAQKIEAVGTLAGGIAHDFNNILAAITGYAELAMEDTKNGKEVSYEVNMVLRAADRARDLVKRILTFSRKMDVQLVPLDLNKEVKQAVDMLRRTIPKMIEIELYLSKGNMTVLGDSGQLEQVLLNLGTNARDAMPEGGRLIIETTETVLDEEYCRLHNEASPGHYVLLRVSDTGTGMDRETREHIFDPFFTTKDVGSGTGMGLAMVFGILKSHGGYVTCYSEPGTGTTFKLYFPAREQTAVTRKLLAEPARTASAGHENILVVDDEPFIRDIVERLLTSQGYRCALAANGEEALELYLDRPGEFDLVLLDVSMPGMGGHRCLQKLLEIDPKARVIVASGYSSNGSINETLELGAACFVPKPFKRNELFTAIRRLLDTGSCDES